MRRGVSLKDIAQKAGVSTALVSYVLNNTRENRTNKDTAQRIRDTASQLNYKINQVAKSLKTNKTYTIGLIVSDISNSFSASLARIIENESEKYNYTTIFGSSDEDIHKFEKLINTFINRKVDGLIISPPAKSEDLIKNLQQQGIPFVLLDRYFPEIKTNYIILDNFTASFDAVNHLIDTGRKRIGMITYQSDLFHLEERTRGYSSALKKNNIAYEKGWLKQVDIINDNSAIENAVKELLSVSPAVDAVLFGSNVIAMCSLKYINTLPLNVPNDLAIVSFDQASMLDIFYSPVTYIKQPLEEIGQLAIKTLLESMKDSSAVTQIKLQAELIIQQSTKYYNKN
jgi:LacI family transcriptional regulator